MRSEANSNTCCPRTDMLLVPRQLRQLFLWTRPYSCRFFQKDKYTFKRERSPRWQDVVDLPLPFCHAVYQDRLRKDVKKIIAVATVPFLSLISFQRSLSSAECRGPRSGRCLPPSFSRCLRGVEAGVKRRHTVASKRCKNRSERHGPLRLGGECSDVPSVSSRRWDWLLLYRPPATRSRVNCLPWQHG